jgi:hypothetical protein
MKQMMRHTHQQMSIYIDTTNIDNNVPENGILQGRCYDIVMTLQNLHGGSFFV